LGIVTVLNSAGHEGSGTSPLLLFVVVLLEFEASGGGGEFVDEEDIVETGDLERMS
jgi:hypothetical protein